MLMLSVDLKKSVRLKVPSFVKKNIPDIKKIAEITSNRLFDRSSINKIKNAVPRIKKIDGRTRFDKLRKS